MPQNLPRFGLVVGSVLLIQLPCLPNSGAEEIRDTPEVFTEVLRSWAAKHKIEKAALVVRRDGEIVQARDRGSSSSARPRRNHRPLFGG